MNIYLCGPTARASELNQFQVLIELRGHKVTSRWHSEESPRLELDDPLMQERAVMDLEDVDSCDTVIVFDGSKTNRGGRHYETGYAKGRGKLVWLCGKREHAFHTLSDREFPDFLSLLIALG